MPSKAAHWLRSALLAAACLTPVVATRLALAEPASASASREVEIVVDGGYSPSRIEIHEGERVRLKFVRKDASSCTKEVLIPKLKIRRELPQNQPVIIDLPALSIGEYEFKCGMNMVRGTLVVLGHHHHG
jgi:plastocyanin domain-containing protein